MITEKYKNYFFLTEGISNYGGAQLLVLRRAKYLQNLGLNVKIIVQRHRGVFFLEKEFEQIPVLFLPDLEYPFFYHSKKRKQNLSKTVQLFLKDTKNSILETSSLQEAVWGEFFASELKMKHIVYLLNEAQIDKYRYYPGNKFFIFKYNRGELFGTSDQSLEIIFNKCLPGFKEQYINVSFNPDELQDKTEPEIEKLELENNAKTICTICRLEKGYLKDLIRACMKFADSYPEQNINLIIVGGTIHKDVEDKFKKEFLSPQTVPPNLKIYFTGYITKLGKDLFKMIDVFVGMGTSSINSISQGCVTLNIDPQTNMTSGIFGVDTNNFAYPRNHKVYSIEKKLFSILNDPIQYNEAKTSGAVLFNSQYTDEACFGKLLFLLRKSDQNPHYYNLKEFFSRRLIDFALFQIRKFRAKLVHYPL